MKQFVLVIALVGAGKHYQHLNGPEKESAKKEAIKMFEIIEKLNS